MYIYLNILHIYAYIIIHVYTVYSYNELLSSIITCSSLVHLHIPDIVWLYIRISYVCSIKELSMQHLD